MERLQESDCPKKRVDGPADCGPGRYQKCDTQLSVTTQPASFGARHRDALVALGLALAFGVLYVLTLCPTVTWYDSAEYAGAAVTLGIPHPPGYPLYTLLAAAFVQLPFEPAYSVNLMSAVFASVALALAYLLQRRVGVGVAAAIVGAATLGASRLFWSQAVIAEVYTTTLALLLLILLLLVRGLREDRVRPLLLAAFVAGLGLGVHLSLATYGLGFAVLVFGLGLPITRPSDLLRLFTRERLGRRLAAAGNLWFFFNYNVHDIEVFFLPAVLALCLFVGAGAEALFAAVARTVSVERGRRLGTAVRVLACAFPISLVLANFEANDL